MNDELKIKRFKGAAVREFIPYLAKLRMDVFREYPYLYDGDLDYETDYLHTYVCCSESNIVIVFDGKRIVGASTAIPLQHETSECQAPFINQKMNVNEIFYLGESVLLPKYRGQGLYKYFFSEREEAAREFGSKISVFCGVDRPLDDPRRPSSHRTLNPVWERFGYEKQNNLYAYYSWKEIDQTERTTKPMAFWLKTL
ncbi:MAG: GNAT family N-acetyltransferase [Gammaproteobacteria bacterium]